MVYGFWKKIKKKGAHLLPLIIWPKVPLFKMPKCDTEGCLKARE